MKRLVSLALVALLLLNVLGYYALFFGLQYRNDRAMTRMFDSGTYEESQAITIKLPLTVPYLNDNPGFQRVDGKFWHGGEFYRLVKQKYAKDTLTVVCVKDPENVRIQDALSDFVKTFTDAPIENQANAKLVFSISKDYIQESFYLETLSAGWQVEISQRDCCLQLVSTFVPTIKHPPERGGSSVAGRP